MIYVNITPPNFQILNKRIQPLENNAGFSRAIKSMRTLGPKEIEGLGLVPGIREAYTFRKSEFKDL